MKNTRKMLIFVLVLSVFLTLAAGCGQTAPTPTDPPTEAPMVPATEPPTDPAPQEMSAPDLAEYVQARSVTITVESKSGGSSNGQCFR